MNISNPVLKPVAYSTLVGQRCLKANIAVVEKSFTKNGWGGYLRNKVWSSFETAETYYASVPIDLKVEGGVVHSVGFYTNAQYLVKPVHWRDKKWNVLPLYDKSQRGSAAAVSIHDTSVHIGGYYEPKQNRTIACVWIDGVLHDLQQEDETGKVFTYSRVSSVFATSAGYYAAGHVLIGNKVVVGYWRDGVWHTAEKNATVRGSVRSIAVKPITNDVILAGNVETANERSPGYWINDKWHEVENPNGKGDAFPFDLAVNGNDIVMCGARANEYGDLSPGYWVDGAWHFLGVPNNKIARQGCATRIGILDGKLSFGGYAYDERYDRQFPCVWEDNSLITIETDSPNKAHVAGLGF